MYVHLLAKPLLTYKGVVNLSTGMKVMYDGVIHVGSRMKWYCELANLLLKEDTAGAQKAARLRDELKQRLTDLYQALLLFLFRSVAYCFRDRFVAILRDLSMWDDWKGALVSIEAAERGFLQDKDDYNTEIIRHATEDIRGILQAHLTFAFNQEDALHKDLQSLLEAHELTLKEQERTNSILQKEASQRASQRASDKLEKKDKEFIDLLCLSDPRLDQERIEMSKGVLLEASYDWILEDLNHWRDDRQSRLLRIEGTPGKGKTMLLCGIIKELKKSMTDLSYFFCQATDKRISNAKAVLQGLLYMLFNQQPSLISNARDKHHIPRSLDEEPNAWLTLSKIFKDILGDPNLKETYVVIDALDECVEDLPDLLKIIQESLKSSTSHIRWIVSSRPNNTDIETELPLDGSQMSLSLETEDYAEKVARAVDIYIDHSVCKLAKDNNYDKYDKTLQKKVLDEMRRKSDSTFLWVSLVIKSLERSKSWNVLSIIEKMPSGLIELYQRMLDQTQALEDEDPKRCRLILSTVITVKEPLRLEELGVLFGLPKEVASKKEIVAEMVNMCGSFLTIQYEFVRIVHQSANDFLRKQGQEIIFPSGTNDVHYKIFSTSINTLLKTLDRDMYKLKAPGFPINKLERPKLDPLAAARYGCVYWVDHLCDSGNALHHKVFRNESDIDKFMREKYLYWLEALSLCRSMPKGVQSMGKLEALIQVALYPFIPSGTTVYNLC